MNDIEPAVGGPNDQPELVERDVPRIVETTGTDEAGNPVVAAVDIQYQVVRPLGHFERFTFANDTPVGASDIGYRIEPPPGPPLDRMGAGGVAPPADTWVDLAPPGSCGRRIVVEARIEFVPGTMRLSLDYTSCLTENEIWGIRRAFIRVEGMDPGSLHGSGVLHMEKDDGDYYPEPIPPGAFEFHPD